MLHRTIIETGQALGYRLNDDGVCNGYTMGWIEAMLVDEGPCFDMRLQTILQRKFALKHDIKVIKEKVKSKHYMMQPNDHRLLDIMGFYERLKLYQDAEYYPGLFAKPLSQVDLDELSSVASSASVTAAGGLNTVFSHSYIFTLHELEGYLDNLKKMLATLPVNADLKNTGVVITTPAHVVGVIFNHAQGQWSWFMDVDDDHHQISHTQELVHAKLGYSGKLELVLPQDNFTPEKGKIYLDKQNGELLYTIRHPLGDVINEKLDAILLEENIAAFPCSLLTNEEPLLEEQINPYLPKILEIISRRNHTIETRYHSLNIKVITLGNNQASDEWRNKLAALKSYQPITREIAARCGKASLLQNAALHGHVGIINSLLPYDDLDLHAGEGRSALANAAENGHVEVVRRLLQRKDICINLRNADGATALYLAAQHGHLDIVRLLLAEPNIQVDRPLYNGMTVLCIAASQGHVEILRALLPYINANTGCHKNATPLLLAAQGGHIDVVKVLLGIPDIQVNSEYCNGGVTALYLASQNGHLGVVNALLKHPNIKVNIKIHANGGTALSIAVQNGDAGIVKSLLNHPDINTGLINSELAAMYQHPEVSELLLAYNKAQTTTTIRRLI